MFHYLHACKHSHYSVFLFTAEFMILFPYKSWRYCSSSNTEDSQWCTYPIKKITFILSRRIKRRKHNWCFTHKIDYISSIKLFVIDTKTVYVKISNVIFYLNIIRTYDYVVWNKHNIHSIIIYNFNKLYIFLPIKY